MKLKTLFSTFLFCSIFTFALLGQCTVTNIFAEAHECNDLGEIYVDIEFDIVNPGASNQFTINGNTTNYGTFEYGQAFYTVGPIIPDCNLQYEFQVLDIDNPMCFEYYVFDDPLCCIQGNCQMTSLDFQQNPACIDGIIQTEWLIDGENISEVGYDIFINNVFTTFVPWNSNSGYIFDIVDPGTEFFTLKVCDSDNANCCIENEYANPCFGECPLTEIVASTDNCSDDLFDISISIDYSASSNTFFEIYLNNEIYGTFNSNFFPIQLSQLDIDTETITIDVVQLTSPSCALSTEINNPCQFICSITNIGAEPFCTEDGLFAEISFSYDNPGPSNEFVIAVEGQEYGPFIYGQSNYTVGPMESPCDQVQFINITDLDNNDCSGFLNMQLVEDFCCDDNECSITALNAEAHDCNENGEIFFDISFEVNNPGADNRFRVVGNGNDYGTFEYGESSYTVGPFIANCETAVELIVIDQNNNTCTAFIGFDEIFCCDPSDCQLTTLDFGPNPQCVDGLIISEWLIDGENISEVGFDIFINNEFETFVQWNNTSWYDFDITNPETEFYTIKVCDSDNESCCIEWELENLCYEPTQNDCSISSVEAEAFCTEDGLFASVSFISINPGSSNQFQIDVNGQEFGPYEYGQQFYTAGPFEFPCDQAQFITVTDLDNNECSGFLNLQLEEDFCCDNGECAITDLIADAHDCNETGEIYFDISFTVNNPGADNQFRVVGNANDYGTFEYGEDSYTVGPFIANCETAVELIVIDQNNNECTAFTDFDEIFCCDPSDCQLTSLDFGPIPQCVDGFIVTEWLIDGENISEVGFDIYINNEFETFVQWNNTSWYDFDIANPETEFYTIKVCDNDNGNCCIDWELQNPCFEDNGSESCTISNVAVEQLECNESGEAYFHLTFEYDNVGADNQFRVVGNGNDYGTFEYGQEFYEIGPIESNCQLTLEFIVIDINYNDCSSFTEHAPLCCEEGECVIVEFNVVPTVCSENNTFGVHIDLGIVNGIGNNFDLFIENEFYDYYSADDLPLSLDGLSSDSEYISINVCNNDSENCCAALEFLNPCYEGINECNISEVSAEFIECDEDGQAYFHITFDYSNIGNENLFTIVGNGNNYGTFEYGLEFYSIGPVVADCETELEFIVTDIQNNNCSAFIQHDPVCCDDESNCALSELFLDATECLENNTFNLVVDLEIDGETNDFFDLNINGENVGYYEFNELPITLEELSYDTEYVSVQVCENDHPDCCITVEIENPCSDSSSQENFITNAEVEYISCTDNLITMTIDFDHGENDDSFSISANGIEFGEFDYSDLPITLVDIPADGITNYTFNISDISIDDLNYSVFVGILTCDGNIILDIEDITLNPANIRSVAAYDITGKLIGIFDSEDNFKTIDSQSSVSSGIVILRIDYGTQVVTKKIVRVH